MKYIIITIKVLILLYVCSSKCKDVKGLTVYGMITIGG